MNKNIMSLTSGQSRISQLTSEIRALANSIRSELTRDPSQSMVLNYGLTSNRSAAEPVTSISRTANNHQTYTSVNPSALTEEVFKKSYVTSNPQLQATEDLSSRLSRVSLGHEDSNRFPRSSYTQGSNLPYNVKSISPSKENSIAHGLLELHAKVDQVMANSPAKHPSPSKEQKLATSLNVSSVISKGLLSPPSMSQKLTSSPPKYENNSYKASSLADIKRSQNNSQRNSISPESSKKNKTVTFSDHKDITATSSRDLNITPSKQHLYDKDKLNQILDAIKSRKSTY